MTSSKINNYTVSPGKKVLIITYYWPPSGGIGVLRCLKITKYLRKYGWEPVIYTAKDAHYPTIDRSNEEDVPEGLTVLRRKIWEPYAIYKFLTGQSQDTNVNNIFYVEETETGWMHQLSVWIRSNFFIPDARAAWIRPSVRFLTDYLEDHAVDALISSGPPHTNTRIATLLSRETGIPWLADFRDPWTQVDYFKKLRLTSWGRARHERMEQEAFERAEAVTIVSPSWKKDLEKIGAKNVSVVTNGFDPEDFEDIPKRQDERFTLTHVGIMGADRNAERFYEAVSELVEERPHLKESLHIRLVGQVDVAVRESIEAAGLGDMVEYTGSVPRDRALEIMRNSRILLLLLNQQENVRGRIPGKLFEYLAVRRPILNIGPVDSDVAGILDDIDECVTCDYPDKEGFKRILRHFYEEYRDGSLDKDLQSDISQYSIDHLTGKIAGLLDDMVDG